MMRTIVIIVSIFSAFSLGNVIGISVVRKPIRFDDPIGPIGPICTADVKICTAYEYLGTGPDGCPKCLPREIGPIGPICTADMKICTSYEYLGTGPDGCPKCLPREIGPIGPICTADVKICSKSQYLGTGPDGCPKCLPRCIGTRCLIQPIPITAEIYPAIN